MSRLVAFSIVGSVGFAIDAGLLSLLSLHYEINVYVSRAFSFIAATLVTWLLNRSMVFAAQASTMHQKRREYKRYFLVQLGGALLNLGVFSVLVNIFPSLHQIPVVPLAVGAVFGLMFSFTGSRLWVFKNKFAEI